MHASPVVGTVVCSTTRVLHTSVREHIVKSRRTGYLLPGIPQHSNIRLHAKKCRVSEAKTMILILFQIVNVVSRFCSFLNLCDSLILSLVLIDID